MASWMKLSPPELQLHMRSVLAASILSAVACNFLYKGKIQLIRWNCGLLTLAGGVFVMAVYNLICLPSDMWLEGTD